MNRQEFKDILDSITIPEECDKKQMSQDLRPLNVALLQMIPERLYKYRACCPNHINAFKKDEVWMSTSDLFNDPFDTLIQCDSQEILNAFNVIDNPQLLQGIAMYVADGGFIPEPLNGMLSDEDKKATQNMAEHFLINKNYKNLDTESLQQLKSQATIVLSILSTIIQHVSTSACFSEDIKSVLMWSHYSEYHQGFALGYDLRPFLLPNKENLGLFPVVYSEQRYNATQYFCYWIGKLMKLPLKNQDTLAHIKLLLHKSKEWNYEKEWRLINGQNKNVFNKNAEPRIIRPNSIYYGCHISEDNRKQLHEISIEKNLQEYQMRIDDSSMIYEVKADEIKNTDN